MHTRWHSLMSYNIGGVKPPLSLDRENNGRESDGSGENSPYLRTLSLYHLQQDHKPMLESNHRQWWRHLRRERSDNSINTHMTMGLSSVVSNNSTWTYGQLALGEGSTRTRQGMNRPKGWTSAHMPECWTSANIL